jgi:hypothetical protein
MRLVSEDSSSLTFRPRWTFPVMLAAARTMAGETVKLTFATADDGGTRVAVAGKVGASVKKLATREFWAETLQAT